MAVPESAGMGAGDWAEPNVRRQSVKAPMRTYALAAFAVLASPGSFTRRLDTDTEHISRTVKLDPGGTLRLKNFSGRVYDHRTDRPDVVIDAVRRARGTAGPDQARHPHRGSTLVVDANHRDHSWSEFMGPQQRSSKPTSTIQVPRRTNLTSNVFSSPVTVAGWRDHTKSTASRRRLSWTTSPGRCGRTPSAEPWPSARRPGEDQTIDVDTFSGNVELHVPDSARGSVSFNSFSGH